jgi:cell division FtsZ-interacting protein ZapD
MDEPEYTEENLSPLIAIKDEILDVMNKLRQTQEQLQKVREVSNERIKSLLARGENLAQQISALPGLEQAGKELAEHLSKIGQALLDLKNFDALKKENLVTGVKF